MSLATTLVLPMTTRMVQEIMEYFRSMTITGVMPMWDMELTAMFLATSKIKINFKSII